MVKKVSLSAKKEPEAKTLCPFIVQSTPAKKFDEGHNFTQAHFIIMVTKFLFFW